MNGCDEVREILVAVARGEVVSGPGNRFLREHVESCAACRSRLANEKMLTAGLSALSSTAIPGPPPMLKTALMSEFRRQRVVVPIHKKRVTWTAAAAIAAAALLALLFARERRIDPIAPHPVTSPVATVKAPPAPPLVVPSPQVVTAPQRVARRRPVVKRLVQPVAEAQTVAPQEVATDFFEIPYVEPLRPEERGDVFRIQMPRASMANFGLPVTGGRLDSRVTADVLTGEDGVARAIRFIR